MKQFLPIVLKMMRAGQKIVDTYDSIFKEIKEILYPIRDLLLK